MYSQDETVQAILAFYTELLKQPCISDSCLAIAPPSGWNINEQEIRASGKNDTVIDLLRHLPYLRGSRYDGPFVTYETQSVDYTRQSITSSEQAYPIPGHCVYLTQGEGRDGYSIILDTERGIANPTRADED